MIRAVGPEFFGSFLDAWDTDGSTFPPEVRRHYIDSSVSSVDSIVADYRATASIDLDMDREDRESGKQLTMPVGVISQDWGSQLGFDAASLWRAWAPDLAYEPSRPATSWPKRSPAKSPASSATSPPAPTAALSDRLGGPAHTASPATRPNRMAG